MSIYKGSLRLQVREAARIAAEWKSETADKRGREVACQLFGSPFVVAIEGTHTKFRFYADGRVETINCKPQPRPKTLQMDYSRPVIGFANGRPIYA